MPTPTLSPSASLHAALAAYLDTKIKAVTGLTDSTCLARWPEPTFPLTLSQTRVVLAIERAGAATSGNRLGGPIRSHVVNSGGGVGVARYDHDSVEQPFTLGIWCATDAIRDEVDQLIHGFLNQPMSSTVSPLVSTTLSASILAGTVDVTPASMADIWPNTRLKVGTGGTADTVYVQSVTPSTFRATFQNAHAASATIVEVLPVPKPTAGTGLRLRCANHFNAIGRFDFEPPRYLDNISEPSERQEWRSIRQGIGVLPQLQEVTVALQDSLSIQTTVGTKTKTASIF